MENQGQSAFFSSNATKFEKRVFIERKYEHEETINGNVRIPKTGNH